DLLATYGEKFHPRERPTLRIVQVGVRPRQGRGAFVVMMLFIAMVAAVNVSLLARLARERRRAHQGG
ncbi:MAG: hypothetical protein HYZ27_07000, partial [Deltaproteobacteria bacterium]|nr:hypothetical protein [Deltaproteobacteria bacterium]